MRFVRALAAAGLLLLILTGIPLALAATIGDPRPGWSDLGAGDVSDRALLDALASVTWLAWAYFTVTVLIETMHLARAGGRPRVPTAAVGSRLVRPLLT